MIRTLTIPLVFLFALALPAQEQGAIAQRNNFDFRYAFTVLDDATFYSGRSAFVATPVNQLLLEPKAALKYRDRLTVGANLVGELIDADYVYSKLDVRESYASLSAGAFDLLAGRRIVRWGVGYAFTAAGVLDPPRVATDPTDRLNVLAGRDMVKGEWVHGDQAFALAWSTAALAPALANQLETTAFRYNVLLRSFDTSLLAGAERGGDAFGGLTFTRVFGQAWELHGETVWREQAAVLLGAKFTTRSGITLLGEFYTPPNIAYYRSMTVSPLAGRQHYAFFNISKSRLRELPGWKEWDVSAYAVANLDDQSSTTSVDLSRWFGSHISAYLHAAFPQGAAASEYGAAPYKAATSFGVKFQL